MQFTPCLKFIRLTNLFYHNQCCNPNKIAVLAHGVNDVFLSVFARLTLLSAEAISALSGFILVMRLPRRWLAMTRRTFSVSQTFKVSPNYLNWTIGSLS